MAYTEKDDWSGDAHSGKGEVHYRLYLGRNGKATTICVQWFDYFHYDARRILSPDAWTTEVEAAAALAALMPTFTDADAQIGTNLDEDLRAFTLASAVRDRVSTKNTIETAGDTAPTVNYLHVVLTPADIALIERGGQVRVDIDHRTGDAPPVRITVVYEPQALDDTSYYT